MSRDGVLIGLVGLILGCLLWYGVGAGAWVAQVTMCWVLMALLHVTLAITGGRIYRGPGVTKSTGRVWGAIGLAGAIYAVGDIVQLVMIAKGPVSLGVALGGTVQSVSVVVGTGSVLIVVLTTPIGLATRRERTRFWLDAGIVLTAATIFGAYGYPTSEFSTFWGVVLSLLVGPGLFLVGVFGVLRLVLSPQPPVSRLAGVTLAAAAMLEGVVQAGGSVLVARGLVSWVLGLTVIASALLVGSARIQRLQVRASPDVWRPRPRRPFSTLPYAAIAATQLLLVWDLAKVGLDIHVWIVVAGVVVSSALVIVRQLVAFADNTRILDELDATVDQLRQSLAERELLTAELRHQAFHDPMTGLANRALLGSRLELALKTVDTVGSSRALMIVDLDGFKAVNDRLGHAGGDELLILAARRLRGCVREADLVARVGGDEFAVLIEKLIGPPDEIAERIVAAMDMPFTVSGRLASVGASVGVVVFNGVSRAAEVLLHDADTAMYEAKRAGRGEYRIHA